MSQLSIAFLEAFTFLCSYKNSLASHKPKDEDRCKVSPLLKKGKSLNYQVAALGAEMHRTVILISEDMLGTRAETPDCFRLQGGRILVDNCRVLDAGRAEGAPAPSWVSQQLLQRTALPREGEASPSPQEAAPMKKFKDPEDLPNKINSNSVEINLKFGTKSQPYFPLAGGRISALFCLNWLVTYQAITLEKTKKNKQQQWTVLNKSGWFHTMLAARERTQRVKAAG